MQDFQNIWPTLRNSFLPPLLPPVLPPPPPNVPAFSRLEAELPAVVGAANISTSSAKKTKEKVLDGLIRLHISKVNVILVCLYFRHLLHPIQNYKI